MQLIISPVLYTGDIINCTPVCWTEASFLGGQVLCLTVWGSKLCDYTPNSLGKLPLYVWLWMCMCVCVGGGRDKWLEERETDRLLAFIHVEQEFLTCYYSQSLFFDIMTAVWVTVTWKYGTDVMDMCVTGWVWVTCIHWHCEGLASSEQTESPVQYNTIEHNSLDIKLCASYSIHFFVSDCWSISAVIY